MCPTFARFDCWMTMRLIAVPVMTERSRLRVSPGPPPCQREARSSHRAAFDSHCAPFDDVRRRAGCKHAIESESRHLDERAVFRFGPLDAAGQAEHLEVEQLAERELVARRDDALDDEHARARLRSAADRLQDRRRTLV